MSETVNPNEVAASDLTAADTTANTTTTTKPAKKVIKLDPPVKNAEGGYTVEQVAIEKPDPGFRYNTIKWGLGPESVDADFDKMVAHYGKDTIMTFVNSQLRFALRAKAKFGIPDEEGEGKTEEEIKINQAAKQAAAMVKFTQEHPDGIILTVAEALEYKPGTRERTSWMSLLTQAKIAKKEGRLEDAQELVRQANELMMNDFDMGGDEAVEAPTNS